MKQRKDTLYQEMICRIQQEGYLVSEFAEALNVHRRTLYRFLVTGYIPLSIRQEIIRLLGDEVAGLLYELTHRQKHPERKNPKDKSKQEAVQSVSISQGETHLELPETQDASLVVQSLEGVPPNDAAVTSSNLWLPPSFRQESRPDEVPLDCYTWFGQKATDIHSLVAATRPSSSWQIQAQTRAEIERMLMPHFYGHDDEEVRISRRTALAAIAILPNSLLSKAYNGQWSASNSEEFLTQCARSITACHQLTREDGLPTIAYTLPRYLPILSYFAEQRTPFQKQAADLTAQGYILASFVALHGLRFSERERVTHRALHYSQIAENVSLFVYSLIHLGSNCSEKEPKEPEKALYWYQRAEQQIEKVSPLLRSYVLCNLARAHAQCGHVQEALRYLRLAQEAFPEHPEADDFAMIQWTPSLAMWEGNVYLNLGKLAAGQPRRAKLLSQASWDVFTQVESPLAKIAMPKRLYIETINFSTRAAISLHDFERFEQSLLAGIQGAKELGSQKRYDEACKNWQAARKVWGNEAKLSQLADVLVESKPPNPII